MAKPTYQSFEVAEYSSPELDAAQAYGVIRQIFTEFEKTQARYAFVMFKSSC